MPCYFKSSIFDFQFTATSISILTEIQIIFAPVGPHFYKKLQENFLPQKGFDLLPRHGADLPDLAATFANYDGFLRFSLHHDLCPDLYQRRFLLKQGEDHGGLIRYIIIKQCIDLFADDLGYNKFCR